MKKKNKKMVYSKVPARLFVASRVKAGWRDSGTEFEAEWMSALNGKSYDFSILENSKSNNQKVSDKS